MQKFEDGRSRNFSKNPKIDEVIEGERSAGYPILTLYFLDS
jgi:hypothetical protein